MAGGPAAEGVVDVLTSLWTFVGVTASAVLVAFVPFAWRRRGPVFGLRMAAFALLPAGLAMTGLLTLGGRLGRAFSSFVTHLVFSPVVWFGFTMLGVSVLLALTAQAVRRRGIGAPAPSASSSRGSGSTAAPVGARPAAPALDRKRKAPAAADEFADIEELLRRRGIS
jgi:hypothetical protein